MLFYQRPTPQNEHTAYENAPRNPTTAPQEGTTDVIPGSSGIGNATGASNRGFPGIGGPAEASGASTPSDGGGNLRGLVRRQDSYGSVASGGGGGGGIGGWSGTARSTAGALSESKQDGGEVG